MTLAESLGGSDRAARPSGKTLDAVSSPPLNVVAPVPDGFKAVSYTHLTLPTILRV